MIFTNGYPEDVIQLTKDSGFRCSTTKIHIIHNFTKTRIDKDSYEITNGLHIQDHLDSLEKIDHTTQSIG